MDVLYLVKRLLLKIRRKYRVCMAAMLDGRNNTISLCEIKSIFIQKGPLFSGV